MYTSFLLFVEFPYPTLFGLISPEYFLNLALFRLKIPKSTTQGPQLQNFSRPKGLPTTTPGKRGADRKVGASQGPYMFCKDVGLEKSMYR